MSHQPHNIPLVDLQRQHQMLRAPLQQAIDAVIANSAFLSGRFVERFEQAFAEFCQVDEVVGVSSGTDALWLLLWALGIGPGDEVILPANTFVATAEAIALCGAKPVFVDVEVASCNISLSQIELAINANTKAVIAVHLYGRPAALTELAALCERQQLYLVNDAAQAHGAYYDNQPICQFGIASTFSFYPGKNLGAMGDAGAIATMDRGLAERLRQLRNHGRSQHKYTHAVLGTNARMDDLQANILLTKLAYLPTWLAQRAAHVEAYCHTLRAWGTDRLLLPEADQQALEHVHHLMVLRVRQGLRDSLFERLKAQGIGVGIHYPIPLPFQPCFRQLGHQAGDFPVAELLASEVLSLPLFPELSISEIQVVCQQFEQWWETLDATALLRDEH